MNNKPLHYYLKNKENLNILLEYSCAQITKILDIHEPIIDQMIENI
jgi:hypothetical protein